MAELLGTDVESPVLYVAVNVVVWVVTFTIIAVVAGGDPTGAVVPGVFGGLAFGIASWYLKQRD